MGWNRATGQRGSAARAEQGESGEDSGRRKGKVLPCGAKASASGRVGREAWAETGGGAAVCAAGPEHVRGGKLDRGCGPCAGKRRGVHGLELLVC